MEKKQATLENQPVIPAKAGIQGPEIRDVDTGRIPFGCVGQRESEAVKPVIPNGIAPAGYPINTTSRCTGDEGCGPSSDMNTSISDRTPNSGR